MLHSVKGTRRFTIHATDGDIGHVDRFFFDDLQWVIRFIVVDTGHWLPGRRVLISPHSVRAWNTAKREMAVDLSRQKVKDSPDIDTEQPVSRQHEIELYTHYGLPHYWAGPGLWAPMFPGGLAAAPLHESGAAGDAERAARSGAPAGDPHLRSTREVAGYHVEATDGDIGHVEDFIVDDEEWSIRYLVIDTSNWIGGRKVLVSPKWIVGIRWADAKVSVDVPRERVENSPPYEPARLPTRDEEQTLHRHYRRKGYWEP